VQDDIQPLGRRGALILEDHAAVGLQAALVDVLAADERELHRAAVVVGWRGDRPSGATAAAVLVGKAISVLVCRLQAADERAAGPVRPSSDSHWRRCHDALKTFVFGNLYDQAS
jgi:hypothetical protein